MGLEHSWRDDLFDTPNLNFNLDRNCDGSIIGSKEINQQCWNKITASDPVNGETDQIGTSWNSTQKRWYNNVNDCSESNPCPTSPCCLDEYQNNNVMAYNAHQCSFTFLQIKKTLQQLLSYKCDYINTIRTNRTCWAPSAFISLPLPGNEDYGYCSTCFDFTASYNEHKYLVRVYKISGGALIYNSGWINSTAGKLCFKNYGISVGTGRYLEPDVDYSIELTVARDPVGGQNCALTDTYIRYFTSGACEPDYYDPPLVFTEMIISPNPASSSIELTYDAFEGEEFAIFAVNQSTAQLSLLSNSMYATANGENEYELSISSLSNGTYTIFMIGVENNHYQTLLKQ